MALRLLPFRQYAEQDVINMFALQKTDINEITTGAGSGDAGVWVKVTQGGLNNGPTTYDNQYGSYLGMDPSSVPYVGRDQYPRVTTEVGVAHSGDAAIGVTLYQTAQFDENNQKLLYYPQKKLETQSVLPGESVPVLKRGIITVPAGGNLTATGTVNSALGLDLGGQIDPNDNTPSADVIGWKVTLKQDESDADGCYFARGQLTGIAPDGLGFGTPASPPTGIGTILATGSRVVKSGQNADQFAGNPTRAGTYEGVNASCTGYYAIISFDTNNLYA